MKAEELMIGDWVQNPLGYKAQIQSIKYMNVIKDEWEYLFRIGNSDETYQDCLSEEDIFPIPLTPEILEKNGFVQDGESWWYQDFRIVLSTSKGVSLVCGRQVKFCYIHQLQHALRLCGINKEIVL